MFHTDVILWLQSWSSPALTTTMLVISLLGYTRAYLAVATVLAFACSFRPAVVLLLLLALNGVVTDVAKTAAARPRPDAVDARVQALGIVRQPGRPANTSADGDDGYGFPSGHVSATTVFCLGGAALFGWAWMRIGAAVWIPLMALSRMYQGRHFPGDVLGGFALGIVTLALGLRVLKLDVLAKPARIDASQRVAVGVLLVSSILAATSMVSVPDPSDAGRLMGLATAVIVLVHYRIRDVSLSPRGCVMAVALAACSFAVFWGITTLVADAAGWSNPASRFATGLFPSIALLLLPLHALQWTPSGRTIRV